MNYENLTDIEINARVSRALYGDVSRGHQMALASGEVDYCNRIEDAWPIIEENNISLILDNPTMPCATSNARDLFNDDDTEVGVAYGKPLRAAMIYQLYRAVDRRDNTEALWLLRAPSGAHLMEEMAYLGKVPRPKDIGRHVSQIKRTTLAKPDFYVFESMYGWAMHCDHKTRHLIDQWGSRV